MVGDRYRAVDAGRAAGCVTILVAGPEEAEYEGNTGNRSTRYGDNQCGRRC